jgi:carboxypeptidase D
VPLRAHIYQVQLCETTPGVKSWSGYVNLPPDPAEGRDYPTHTFFWFFESRKNPAIAPLSVWLQGGPGSPSIPAAIGENGPCTVTADSTDTVLNPWSWTNEANMLYIDQPVSIGFSYDTLTNGTIDEFSSPFNVTAHGNAALKALETNSTVLGGTFSDQVSLTTSNTTMTAARVAWHFMQTWMEE